jgi:hypothetical protein
MKKDRLFKIMLVMVLFLAFLFFSVGKWTYCAIALIVAAGGYMNLGGGDFNKRNLYEKRVPNEKNWTLDTIYEKLSDMDTPLGKCWLGRNTEKKESCIVFGPAPFKDYILISISGNDIKLLSGSSTEHLEAPESEQWRFDNLLDTANLEVTPKRYSAFAADKVVTAVLLEDLKNLMASLVSGQGTVPESLDMYTLYHYNSTDTTVRDRFDNCYARTSVAYEPLSIKIYDMDGQEVASVVPDGEEKNQKYTVTVSGEADGSAYHDKKAKDADVYYLEGPDGRFELRSFRAVRRGNIGMNYILTLNGEPKAIMASSPRIRFESTGLIENDVICSLDDEYLLWYIIIQEIVTSQSYFVK